MEKYSTKELEQITQKFLKLHYQTGLGIPIDKRIHKLFHDNYKYTNNNIEQFEEFKKRLHNGEFNTYLEQHNLKLPN
jgi:hypothetical protein